MIVKTDNSNFDRDTSSGALININKSELEILKHKRKLELSRKQEILDLKSQIEELKKLISERK